MERFLSMREALCKSREADITKLDDVSHVQKRHYYLIILLTVSYEVSYVRRKLSKEWLNIPSFIIEPKQIEGSPNQIGSTRFHQRIKLQCKYRQEFIRTSI